MCSISTMPIVLNSAVFWSIILNDYSITETLALAILISPCKPYWCSSINNHPRAATEGETTTHTTHTHNHPYTQRHTATHIHTQ